MSRLLRDDAVRLWAGGEPGEAAGRAAAIFGMARQRSSGELWLIDALVADSLLRYGVELTTCMLDSPSHQLTAPQRRALLDAIDRLDSKDPSALRQTWRYAWRSELAFARANLENHRVGDDLRMAIGEARGVQAFSHALFVPLVNSLKPGGSPLPDGNPVDHAAAELHDKAPDIAVDVWTLRWSQLDAEAARAEHLGLRAEDAWEAIDADEALRTIDRTCEEDTVGVVAGVVCLPHSFWKKWRKGVDDLAALRKRLAE